MRCFYFLILPFSFLLFTACRPSAAPVSIGNKPISINDVPLTNVPMPPAKPLGEMTWTIFNGSTNADAGDQKLKDLQGKVVILDFWATYCPPCLEEIPHLKELQSKYGRENLEIVGLHVGGEDDRPQIPVFVERLKIDYTLATPEDALTNFVFGARNDIPQTAVFDRKGVLIEKFIGFDPAIKNRLDETVERAVKQ